MRTLGEAYALARANLESIASSEQSLRQAEALYSRALGLSLPEASLRSQTDVRDKSPVRQALTDVFLRVGQTGFNGYRELAALKLARADEARVEAQLRRAEQLLLSDVAAAFFGLMQSQADVAATKELADLAGKRLDELRERVRVGRTREADYIAQEVQSEGLSSQREESARQADARADLLRFLTKAPEVAPQTADVHLTEADRPLEDYLNRVDSRPDVEAARRAAQSALAAVRLARADRLPQLGYQFNYYLSRPNPALRSGGDWDASVTAALPLFSWGARSAFVASAKAGQTIQELAHATARRGAELEIRNAWRDYSVARRQLEIKNKTLALAQREYALQRRDESRGLVTALEVLDSFNRLNGARLDQSRAVLTARLSALTLELAAGAAPKEIDLR